MINNDFGKNFLKNFQNRNARNDAPADLVSRLKARANKGQDAEAAAAPADDAAPKDVFETKRQALRDLVNTYSQPKGKGKADAEKPNANANANSAAPQGNANGNDKKLTAEEKRQQEIADIMEKLDAEEDQRYGNRYKDKNDNRPDHANASSDNNRYKDKDKSKDGDKTGDSVSGSKGTASSNVTSEVNKPGEVEDFLNEMPLFNEFKTSLMDAFKNMDSGTSGSIRAQYELNYSSMQAIANAAGGFDYEETTVNVKFDLSYVKAANGGTSGGEIAKAIEGATDFASLMDALEQVSSDPNFGGTLSAGNGAGQAVGNAGAAGAPEPAAVSDADAAKTAKDELLKKMKDAAKPDFSQLIPGLSQGNLQQSMQDYFSPEATAGRILDFATAFFPMSDAYKKGGDTEEARKEFADMMGKAVQKGFDQAQGALGKVPDATQAGIDKTHELVFKGFDDFVKNGLKPEKQDTYDALQGLEFTYESTVTKKKVSMSYSPDNNRNQNQTQTPSNTAAALDTQA